MLVVVAYASHFGCTRAVAEAIAAGLCAGPEPPDVECRLAAHLDLALVTGADLLVVGAPTHHRTLPTSGTSVVAQQLARLGKSRRNGGDPSVDLRAWLKHLPRPDGAGRAAAFDTRLPVRGAGGAGWAIAHRLRRHGYHLVEPVEGFVVEGPQGPLRAGELDHAGSWGGLLRRALRAGVP